MIDHNIRTRTDLETASQSSGGDRLDKEHAGLLALNRSNQQPAQ
jgi:hypothetical protein